MVNTNKIFNSYSNNFTGIYYSHDSLEEFATLISGDVTGNEFENIYKKYRIFDKTDNSIGDLTTLLALAPPPPVPPV